MDLHHFSSQCEQLEIRIDYSYSFPLHARLTRANKKTENKGIFIWKLNLNFVKTLAFCIDGLLIFEVTKDVETHLTELESPFKLNNYY